MEARRIHLAQENLGVHVSVVDSLKEALPRQRLPQDYRRGEDVGPVIELLPQKLLRRHVAQLALNLPLTRDLHAAARLRNPEVDEVRVAVRSNHILSDLHAGQLTVLILYPRNIGCWSNWVSKRTASNEMAPMGHQRVKRVDPRTIFCTRLCSDGGNHPAGRVRLS